MITVLITASIKCVLDFDPQSQPHIFWDLSWTCYLERTANKGTNAKLFIVTMGP